MRVFLSPLVLVAIASLLHMGANAGEWPRFRGPSGDGVVRGESVPLQWSEMENIAWKAEIPGKGHSSPVIADGRIWMTTAISSPLSAEELKEKLAGIANSNGLEVVGKLSLRALCFDQASGKLIHNTEVFVPDSPEPIHYTNTYASPTPILRQGKVYVHFGTYGCAALDAESGSVDWTFNDLHVVHQNGPGSTPILWENLLITHYDGTDQQFLAAINVNDGSLAWQTSRSGEMDPKPDLQKAYCTPTIVTTPAGPELISPAANWVYAYNPANGSELWKANYGELGFSTVPCPVVGHGMAYVCTSFMKSRLLAVRYGGQGDVTDSHIAWTSDSQIPKKPSLALVDDLLIVGNDAGIVTCLNALTGEEIWRERIGGNYSASPLVVNDLVYFFSQEGKTTIIRVGEKFEEVAVNELASGCNASPAVADGALYVRTDTHLYCIKER